MQEALSLAEPSPWKSLAFIQMCIQYQIIGRSRSELVEIKSAPCKFLTEFIGTDDGVWVSLRED